MSTPVPARARSAALIAATLAAIACGESTPLTAPQRLEPAAPTLARSDRADHDRRPVIGRGQSLAADETACRFIDPARVKRDVSIKLDNAGLKVTFPLGSVPAPSNICLTAHAGGLLTYNFEPHGLQFVRPIIVQQDLRRTRAYHDRSVAAALVAGYLVDGVDADVDGDGNARFAETFPTSVYDDAGALTTARPSMVTFRTSHFSGYALASGRLTDSLPASK